VTPFKEFNIPICGWDTGSFGAIPGYSSWISQTIWADSLSEDADMEKQNERSK